MKKQLSSTHATSRVRAIGQRFGLTALAAALGLATTAQSAIIDDDTLVYISSDIAPAANAEMNDLRAAGDTTKPAVTLTYASQPAQVADASLPSVFDGYYGFAEKTGNANVLEFTGQALLKMNDTSYLDDDFTVEFFFRADSLPGLMSGDAAYLAIQQANWYIGLASNGDVNFYDTTGSSGIQTTSKSYVDGKWHHYAVVWDKGDSTVRFYIDHSPFVERVLETPMPKASTGSGVDRNSLCFGSGCWGNGQGPLGGRYDGIRITQRALHPMEFQSPRIYPVDSDTLFYMNFDETTKAENTVPLSSTALTASRQNSYASYNRSESVVSSSLQPGALSDNPFTNAMALTATIDSGKSNSQAGFGYLFSDPSGLTGTNSFSAEVFAKVTAIPPSGGTYGCIFFQNNIWRMALDKDGGGKLYCSMWGDPQGEFHYLGDATVSDGDWHHLAAVYDGARQTFTFYLDYAAVKRHEDVVCPLRSGGYAYPGTLLFGGNSAQDTGMTGSIPGVLYDELRITGRALTVAEFLTAENLGDPVFHARFEDSLAASAPTGRYATTATPSATGAATVCDARVSHEIRGAGHTPLFSNAAGLALSGGTVSYSASGTLDLAAGTAECFVQRTIGGAGDHVIAFAPGSDASSALWSLAADGTVSIATTADSETLSVGLSDGKWHHFALSWSQGAATTAVKVWLDHELAGEATLDGAFDFGPGAGFVLGSAGFSGSIDELRLRKGVIGADGMLYAAPPPATVITMR